MTTRPRNEPLRGQERAAVARQLAKLYNAGACIRAIATRTKRSYGTVHALLVEAGVTFRSHGGR